MFNHQQLHVKRKFDHVSHHLLLHILKSQGILWIGMVSEGRHDAGARRLVR